MHKKPPGPAKKQRKVFSIRKPLCFWIALALVAFGLPAGWAQADDSHLRESFGSPLTLVELYTSQGCSSCPPVDAFLRDLSDRKDVLTLSFHVDYWNNEDWKDPFSRKSFSLKQQAYQRTLDTAYIYTPQMVVSGQYAVPGGQRDAVLEAIKETTNLSSGGTQLSLSGLENDHIAIAVSANPNTIRATIYAAVFNSQQITRVKGGENRGRILRKVNVVKRLIPISTYTGDGHKFTFALKDLDASPYDGVAVFLQTDNLGPVLAASALSPRPIQSAQVKPPEPDSAALQ